jgi:Transglutaminase-like superfamily
MYQQQLDGVTKRHLRQKYTSVHRDSWKRGPAKHVMAVFLLTIALLLNIFRHQAASTAVVVAFGYYHNHHHHSSAVALTSSPPRGGGSFLDCNDMNDNKNTYHQVHCQHRKHTSNLVILMIYKNDRDQNGEDGDAENKKSSQTSKPFIQRRLFDATMIRPKSLFATVTTRFQNTALQMFSKRNDGIGTSSSSSSSSVFTLAGMSSSTSSAAPSTEPLVATTASPSIQQQISDHVVKVTTDLETINQICTSENRMVDQEASATLISTSTPTPTSSVHLQLTDPIMLQKGSECKPEPALSTDEESKNGSIAATTSKSPFGTTTVIVHTYTDSTTNQTWKALNISKRKFRSYLQYCKVWNNDGSRDSMEKRSSSINRTTINDDFAGIETIHHSILSTSSKSKPKLENADNNSLTKRANQPPQVLENIDHLRNATSQLRDEWRALWKVGRLITDRTELLAVYPSDLNPDAVSSDVEQDSASDTSHSATLTNENEEHQSKPILRKRGGFADLLMLYTDRLIAILSDEHEDSDHYSNSTPGTQYTNIVRWLEDNYGRSETHDLQFENFQTFDESTKLMKLKHFLEWFRSQFPYFYDRCDTCGASIKEDLANFAAASVATDTSPTNASDEAESITLDNTNVNHEASDERNNVIDDTEDSADTESEHQTFVGYVYPNSTELMGKASRTELYQCHQCSSFTRFPRYNSAQFVMSQKRGRCGEYSMLLYRFTRALHHECRWVVDWADHVWVEVLLQSTNPGDSRWIHLDPCEAAVNENFIYQGWGKKQNYILGFYLPTIHKMKASLQHISDHQGSVTSNRTIKTSSNISYIEDITHCYTNEEWNDVCQRRDESESHIQASIIKATHALQQKLLEYFNFTAANTTITR